MKKMIVRYKEKLGLYGRVEEYETNPYPPAMARAVADNLAHMGGYDFKFIPVKA